MTKIRKAIFPVAGFGTRFLPATKSQPKEMLPIVDKPVIHYLVEEAVAAGIEEIFLITGRGKSAIENYFDQSFELEYNLVEKGKHDLLATVKEIPNLAQFIYVRQPLPKGDGDAIMQARHLIGNEPFAVLYGDDIVDNDEPALCQMLRAYENKQTPIVALTEIDKAHSQKYGVVSAQHAEGQTLEINSIVEKPEPENAPSNLGIIGKYILTPEIFQHLEQIEEGTVGDGEVRLADALISYLNAGQKIHGQLIQGTRYDAGSKVGFLKATIDFALKRDDIAPQIKAHLRDIDLSA